MNPKRLTANLLSILTGFTSLAIFYPPEDVTVPLLEHGLFLWTVIGISLLLLTVLGAFSHLLGWGLWFTVLGIIQITVPVIGLGILLTIAGLAGTGTHQRLDTSP